MRYRLLGGVLAATLVVASCTGAGEAPAGGPRSDRAAPGVTDTTVTIGTHQPLTGPAAPGYSRISVGARAVYDYINDNGGVHGRRIDYRVEDDGYNPARTVEVVKKLVLQDEVFAVVGGLGTPTHSKVVDFLNAEGVPDLLVTSGALMWDDPARYPMTFAFQVDYTREGKILGRYVRDNLGDKKIGVFTQNDDVGRDSLAGIDRFLADRIVARETYDPANTDVTPQIEKLRAAGAEVLVCECIPAFTALSVLAAAKIGYRPQLVVGSVGADPAVLAGLLEDFAKRGGATVSGNQLVSGMIGAGYLPPAAITDDPWVRFFKRIHDEYIPDEQFNDTLLYGMVQAYTFGQVLKSAGRDLTRDKLVEAMNTRPVGPGLTPFGFGADSHSGYTGAFVFRVTATGAVEVVQEPMVTDRGAGAVTAADVRRPNPEQAGLVG